MASAGGLFEPTAGNFSMKDCSYQLRAALKKNVDHLEKQTDHESRLLAYQARDVLFQTRHCERSWNDSIEDFFDSIMMPFAIGFFLGMGILAIRVFL
jgi:hypothetical protein